MPTTEVLIIGGGPAGLTMASLLGEFGVDCILVERRTAVNPHPRARSVNVRTNEIFRQLGLAEQIDAVSLPEEWSEQLVYARSLAGAEIGRTPMAVQPIVDGTVVSPARWLLSSQDQIEPIIAKCAALHASVELCFGWEMSHIETTDEGVIAQVSPTGMSAGETITASYVVAADGASSPTRNLLGIQMVGDTDLATLVNCHFHADLDPWTAERPAALYWTTHPARNVFQKIDTNDRWLCQIGYDPRQTGPADFTAEKAADWIRNSIGVADISIDIIDVIPWVMASTVANQFRDGPAFLIGDAAHQLPPSGGFGMNTAIQDAHNLAWKLAYVLSGRADRGLLDTYHTERSPTARYNAARSLENTRNVGRIRKQVEQEGDPAQIAEAIAAAGRYGNWLGMDLGLHYEIGCVIPDGTAPPNVADEVSDYVPTARPGHRAPHFPLGHSGSSSLDLYGRHLTLLLGSGLTLDDFRGLVPQTHALSNTASLDQHSLHGIESSGSLLVRPDGHVAWRQRTDTDHAAVEQALVRLGFRP